MIIIFSNFIFNFFYYAVYFKSLIFHIFIIQINRNHKKKTMDRLIEDIDVRETVSIGGCVFE